jgi:hypothetical protein
LRFFPTPKLIPLLQWEEGVGEEAASDVDLAGNLLSLALSSQWRRGNLRLPMRAPGAAC